MDSMSDERYMAEDKEITTKVKLTPNDIGERVQGAIVAEVMKYGYTILIPFGEGRRYDLVIEKEIEKCDVVCVNCHAKRHWKEKHQTDGWEEILDIE